MVKQPKTDVSGTKHDVPEMFYVGQAGVEVSQPYHLLHPPGTACLLLPHEAERYHAPGGSQDPQHQQRV